MSLNFDQTRMAEILSASIARLDATPKGEKPEFALEVQAITILAFKLELMQSLGKDAFEFFPSLNRLCAMLSPKLMIENLPVYKAMEKAFMADVRDTREGKFNV